MSQKYQRISVRGVIKVDGKVLVEWYSPKCIGFLPGGSIEDEDMSLKGALFRELQEELQGLEYKIGKYLGKIGHYWKTLNGWDSCLNHYFEVECMKDMGVRAAERSREMRWIP